MNRIFQVIDSLCPFLFFLETGRDVIVYMRQNSVFTALDIEGVGREKTKYVLTMYCAKIYFKRGSN